MIPETRQVELAAIGRQTRVEAGFEVVEGCLSCRQRNLVDLVFAVIGYLLLDFDRQGRAIVDTNCPASSFSE